jgi:hypothetical protein
MVDVPDRPNVDVRLAAVKFLFRHMPFTKYLPPIDLYAVYW